MTAYLHSLTCSGPSDCTCETVLRVSESRARARENRYYGITANEAGHSIIGDGPASMLIPSESGRSLSRGMRP